MGERQWRHRKVASLPLSFHFISISHKKKLRSQALIAHSQSTCISQQLREDKKREEKKRRKEKERLQCSLFVPEELKGVFATQSLDVGWIPIGTESKTTNETL